MSRVSGENTSFTGRTWSFRGQGSLQAQKAVYLKKYGFHSQLPLWFFSDVEILLLRMTLTGQKLHSKVSNDESVSFKQHLGKVLFSEQDIKQNHTRLMFLCSPYFPEENLKKKLHLVEILYWVYYYMYWVYILYIIIIIYWVLASKLCTQI